MDYVINIPQPQLIAGQYFKVRYREVGGVFGGYTNYATNPFTLSGLSADDYEIEVIFYNGSEECPAYSGLFTVTNEFDCFDFDSTFIANSSGVPVVRLSWTGGTFPPCGFRVVWYQGLATNAFTISSGATSPFDIIVPNTDNVNIVIFANDCTNFRRCYETEVVYSEPCTPLIVGENAMSFVDDTTFTVTLYMTNSTPFTTSTNITWMQTGTLSSFTPATGTITGISVAPITGPSISFTIKVTAGSYSGFKPTIKGNLVDYCGNVIPFTA